MEEFIALLATYLPTGIVSIVGILLTTFLPKLLDKLVSKSCSHNEEQITQAIECIKTQQAQIEEIHKEIKSIASENAELKKQNRELKQVITKIEQKEE